MDTESFKVSVEKESLKGAKMRKAAVDEYGYDSGFVAAIGSDNHTDAIESIRKGLEIEYPGDEFDFREAEVAGDSPLVNVYYRKKNTDKWKFLVVLL